MKASLQVPTTPRNASELDLRRLFELHARFAADVEERLRMEAEHSRRQDRREFLDAGVVFLHRVVEEAPRRRKLVLDVAQIGLQLSEILVGFELRIGLR